MKKEAREEERKRKRWRAGQAQNKQMCHKPGGGKERGDRGGKRGRRVSSPQQGFFPPLAWISSQKNRCWNQIGAKFLPSHGEDNKRESA